MLPSGLADLHRHLDGSIRPSTLRDLADVHGMTVPADLAFFPGMGLSAALDRFAFTLSVLQEPATVRRVAREICEDATSEGVTTLEVRFAPQLHRGGSMPEVVDAALEGLDDRAGLILCGLYGESPEVLANLVDLGSTRRGVVGIDLAGGPAPDHRWSLLDYEAAFVRATDLGLGRTVHAGEGRPPEEIALAVDRLQANRIGHGTTLLDDPIVTELVLLREVVVEACPTSNWHTGVIARIEDHPMARWLDLGVRVCLNTDNTLLSATAAREELRRVRAIPGMDDKKVERLIATGHAAAFRKGTMQR